MIFALFLMKEVMVCWILMDCVEGSVRCTVRLTSIDHPQIGGAYLLTGRKKHTLMFSLV